MSRDIISLENKKLLEEVREQLLALDPAEANNLEIVAWLSKLDNDVNASQKCTVYFMSDAKEKELHDDFSLIQEGDLYVKETGDYVTRYNNQLHFGNLLEGEYSDPEIDLSNLSEKLLNTDFKKEILAITASREHTPEDRNLLMFAASAGKCDVIKILIALGVSLEHSDMWGNTALTLAARNGQVDAVQLLKALGLDIHVSTDYGSTALMQAAEYGHLTVVQWLVAQGAKIDATNNESMTALMMAAEYGHLPIVQYLVEQGADIDATDNQDKTALMMAAGYGELPVVQYLVAQGADITLECYDATALKIANLSGHLDVSNWLEEQHDKKMGSSKELIELKKLLKQSDLSPDEEQRVHFLLTTIPDSNIMINSNTPAMIYALEHNNVKAAKIILDHTSDVTHLNVLQGLKKLWAFLTLKHTWSEKDKAIVHFLLENDLDQSDGIAMARRNRNIQLVQIINAHQLIHPPTTAIQLASKKIALIKKAGHILGFTKTISNIESVGYSGFESYCMLQDSLNNLIKKSVDTPIGMQQHYLSQNTPIQKALNLSIDWLKADAKISHEDFMLHHAAGNPTFLPIAYSKPISHELTLIAWNDLLIVCNRGDPILELKHMISVFKLPNKALTKQFLEDIMPETGMHTKEKIEQGLRNVIDAEHPILTLPSTEQKHGTCSFVNLKSSLFPMLCFFKLLNATSSRLVLKQFDSAFLKPYLNDKFLSSKFKKMINQAYAEYKVLTKSFRDDEIDELCSAFNSLPSESPDRQIYLEIFSAFINEHHGKSYSRRDNSERAQKMEDDQKRAEKILSLKTMTNIEKQNILSKLFFENLMHNDLMYNELDIIPWLISQGLDLNTLNKEIFDFLKEAEQKRESVQILYTPIHDNPIPSSPKPTAPESATPPTTPKKTK